MKKLFLSLLGVALLAGTLAGCFHKTETYTIDGVPIVLEYGEGPEREHMTLAVGLFRQAALEHWSIDTDLPVWRSLQAVKWITGPVDDQAHYNYLDHTVYANWYECALDVPLYRAFANHYSLMLGNDPSSDQNHRKWAEDLQDDHMETVCSTVDEKSIITLPW